MTTDAQSRTPDPLAPVRAALLAEARRDAAAALKAADAEAARTRRDAENEARALRETARARGESEAAAVLALERLKARRQARSTVLHAQAEVFDEVRRQVRAALPALKEEPAYGAWRDRLDREIHTMLGPDAVVVEHPSGGLSGRVGPRRIVLSLDALADAILEARAAEVTQLWHP